MSFPPYSCEIEATFPNTPETLHFRFILVPNSVNPPEDHSLNQYEIESLGAAAVSAFCPGANPTLAQFASVNPPEQLPDTNCPTREIRGWTVSLLNPAEVGYQPPSTPDQ